jgi:hypothetical protein
MKITISAIEAIREALSGLPPAPRVRTEHTKAGAVTALAPELLELRQKGYGLGALAALLTEKGLPISPGTLKNYLQRAGAARGKRRRRTMGTSSGDPRAHAARATRAMSAGPPPAPPLVEVPAKFSAPSSASTGRSFEPNPRRDSDEI